FAAGLRIRAPSPEGTAENLPIQPSLRDSCSGELVPALKRRAIVGSPFGTPAIIAPPKSGSIRVYLRLKVGSDQLPPSLRGIIRRFLPHAIHQFHIRIDHLVRPPDFFE